MEYTQWGVQWQRGLPRLLGLNPCCNGIYSMRRSQKGLVKKNLTVLILVVMEYTQWVKDFLLDINNLRVLILVVMEYTQWEYKPAVGNFLQVLILVVMEYTQWDFLIGKLLSFVS